MKAHSSYLLYQVARFGVLRFKELEFLCAEKCSTTVLYENIGELLQHGYIERFCHPDIYRNAYRATRIGFKSALGQESVVLPKLRDLDVKHTLRVARTLIDLARFENVSGIATELELPREALREFSHSKIPDGIIQLTRDGASYEVAVEVEVSPKNAQRCDEFLDKYQEAFHRSAYCSGVIVICDAIDIYNRYLNHLAKRDESVRSRILLIQGPGLESLNPEVYGMPRMSPVKCAEKRRGHFGPAFTYSPIVSPEINPKTVSLPPQRGSQTEIVRNKELLQKISQSGT